MGLKVFFECRWQLVQAMASLIAFRVLQLNETIKRNSVNTVLC